MQLIEIIDKFYKSTNGTDSYRILADNMFAFIEQKDKNIAVCYLIYTYARSYILEYEDQAVTPDFAQSCKDIMNLYLSKIKQSYLDNNGIVAISVLDDISADYLLNNKWF